MKRITTAARIWFQNREFGAPDTRFKNIYTARPSKSFLIVTKPQQLESPTRECPSLRTGNNLEPQAIYFSICHLRDVWRDAESPLSSSRKRLPLIANGRKCREAKMQPRAAKLVKVVKVSFFATAKKRYQTHGGQRTAS